MHSANCRTAVLTCVAAFAALSVLFAGASPYVPNIATNAPTHYGDPGQMGEKRGATGQVTLAGHSQALADSNSAAASVDDSVDPSQQLTALQTALKPKNPALPQAKKDRDTTLAIVNALPAGPPSASTDSVEALRKAQQTLANKTLIPSRDALDALNTRLKNNLDPNNADGLQKQYTDLKNALDEAAKIDVTKIKDDTVRKTFSDTRKNSNDVSGQMDTVLSDIKNKILPDANTSLVDRVKGLADYAKSLADVLQKAYKASGITGLAADAKPETIRTTLVSGQRGLLAAEQVRIALLPVWKDTNTTLAAVTDYKSTDVQNALDAMTNAVTDADKGVLAHLPGWLDAVRKEASDEIATLQTQTDDLSKTLAARERDTAIVTKAASTRDEANQQVYDLNTITTDAPALFAFWEANGLKAQVTGTEKSFSTLRETSGQLSIRAGVLDSLISGDADHFVQEQVRLFYFSDVPRIIQAINPKARLVTDTRTEAAQLRKNNANADLLNEAKQIAGLNEEIARHQDRVRAIQESIRQANAQLADARNRQQQAQARQKALSRQANSIANQKQNLTAQKTALTSQNMVLDQQITTIDQQLADPNVKSDAAKVADMQNQKLQKQQQKDANTAKINDLGLQISGLVTGTVAQQEATQAAADFGTAITTIQGQISQFNDQLAQLTPQLAAAKQDLIDAQVRRAAARQESYALAQAEAETFGEARDNQPFWYAPSEGILSNDPAHRVILTGYADSSVINIRGLPRDVQRVREIIASFDRPAPQSRITLYTMQINGAQTKSLNAAFKDVDDTLRDARGSIVLVQDKFRDSVNEEVRQYAAAAGRFDGARQEDRGRLKRYTYYAPEISRALGFPGDIRGYKDYASVALLTRWTLPDPADCTTLGEAMFVYSLGGYESRLRILGRFIAGIYKEYKTLNGNRGADRSPPRYGQIDGVRRFLYAIRPIIAQPDSCSLYPTFSEVLKNDGDTSSQLNAFLIDHDILNPDPHGPTGGYPHFFLTILGSVVNTADQTKDEMTANQLEILKALQTKSREAVSAEVNYLLREIDRLPASERWGSNTVGDMYRELYLPLIGWLHNKFPSTYNNGLPIDDSLKSWRDKGQDAIRLNESYPNIPARYLTADLHAHSIAHLVHETNALAQATARVAAADDMIKRMIIIVEDDVDYFFINHALEDLQAKVTSRGVELGTLQRESILATNRLIARVDPRATAIANLANGTDFLNQAQQLGQIAAQFRETQRSAKLNTTLPLFGAGVDALAQGHAGTALAFGGLLSLLGDLATTPQAPQGELFSITSGDKFQITPIFDPSGQALRFKFDYVSQTLVQAPDGSVTPDPSRVDRHTVNTEVQLTNLEVREISRFESNARLGTPELRTGGIPILNQLPVLRDIPILGYYYRRKASAATRQESLIFAQTSLYPTIGDIMNLLTDVPLRSGIESETPRYLQGDPLLALEAVTLDKPNAVPGDTVKGTLKLDHPAPTGGAEVGLISSDGKTVLQDSKGIPTTSIAVPAGEQTASFQVVTGTSSKNTVYITGSYGGALKEAALSVSPPPPPAVDLAALPFDKPSITGGGDVTGTITFTALPKAAGTINLHSNNDSLFFDRIQLPFQVADVDAITLKLKSTFKAHTRPVASTTPVAISADAGGKTALGAILLNPPRLQSFYVVPDPAHRQYQLFLILDGPASQDMNAVVGSESPYLPLSGTKPFEPGRQVLSLPIPYAYLPSSVKAPQQVQIWARAGQGGPQFLTLTLDHRRREKATKNGKGYKQ